MIHYTPTPPPQRLSRNRQETTSVSTRNRRSGDEALERKPFIAQLLCSKPMKRILFLRRPITHNFKQPHSKVEEPDCLSRWNLPSLIITTQSLEGGFIRPTSWMGNRRHRGLGFRYCVHRPVLEMFIVAFA